jgi:hypothetical protein
VHSGSAIRRRVARCDSHRLRDVERGQYLAFWLTTLRVLSSQITAAAAACFASGAGCSNGSLDTSVYHPPIPVTLVWDQPDNLAEYYQVKTGALMTRVEQAMVRLELEPASHRVEITSCNEAGCSEPTAVVLEYHEGRWTLAPEATSSRERPQVTPPRRARRAVPAG